MALPLPDKYPVFIGYPPVDAEYPCITYTHDASDNKFVGLARGTQVYAFTAWAKTRDEVNEVSTSLTRLINYTDSYIEDVYLENRTSGYDNGLYYTTTYLRVVLKGAYKQ